MNEDTYCKIYTLISMYCLNNMAVAVYKKIQKQELDVVIDVKLLPSI